MPEAKIFEYTYKELAEVLVRNQDLHEGQWGIYIKFGIRGGNIAAGPGGDVTPAAIIPVLKIGIQRFDEANNLTVDASEVNPKPSQAEKRKK